MGSRVPVYTGKEHGMLCLDVGSNMDWTASRIRDNKFDLLVVARAIVVGGQCSSFC
jgi:hypothetical protein